MQSRGKAASSNVPAFRPETAEIRASQWRCADKQAFDITHASRLTGLSGFAEVRRLADTLPSDASVVVVVDTVQATFELEEILFELREFPVALQPSTSGYLFSYIKTFRDRPECILPDRADLTESTHCLRAYLKHLSEVGQRRGAEVLGDQLSGGEALFGADEPVVAADLLQVPRGRITELGIRSNISLVLATLAEVFSGRPDPPEDCTSVELARAQLWQWVHLETGVLDSGEIITMALVERWLNEEVAELQGVAKDAGRPSGPLDRAARLLAELTRAEEIAPFLMAEAYRHVD